MTVSVFSLIKNESAFIGYGLMSILDYVDEVVYFDGNSTDGTLALLDHIKTKYDTKNKIRVYLDKDFKDFKDAYVKKFNECMKECRGDYLWYLHPDMVLTSYGSLPERDKWTAKAFSVNMRSFAGESMEYEIVQGRTRTWKTIMRNAFGLHYYGAYGAQNEDMYFRAITGESHELYENMRLYPYRVEDSGIKLWHFCECKPLNRRKEKMDRVIRTVSGIKDEAEIEKILLSHPRVNLDGKEKSFGVFEFAERKDPLPEVFQKYKPEFDEVLGK